ncbi:MAG: tetratricopeptide repeat protein [Pseudomonadota bacterium]
MPVSWVEIALLLVGGLLGWYATRRWRIGQAPPSVRTPSRDYLAGLNFLVNEQPDRAVEAFLRAVAVDSDTVETHFALGALFRRRGEVDRAIRVHQNLIARDALDPAYREQATYALAQDYLRAGLLDRAEKLLLQLSEAGTYRLVALKDLVRVYEIQRDWDRAIATHRDMAKVTNPLQPQAVAHYYCELAEAARANGDFEAARSHLRAARGDQRRFPRGALIRADVALDLGDAEMAIRLLKRVLLQQPSLAFEVLPRLVKALRAAGREKELDAVLGDLAAQAPEVAGALAYAAIVSGELDSPVLLALSREYANAEPAVAEMIEALWPKGTPLDDAALRRVGGALRRQALRNPRFRCGECGFSSTTFFWQCPGCKTWDGLRPLEPRDLAGPLPMSRAR